MYNQEGSSRTLTRITSAQQTNRSKQKQKPPPREGRDDHYRNLKGRESEEDDELSSRTSSLGQKYGWFLTLLAVMAMVGIILGILYGTHVLPVAKTAASSGGGSGGGTGGSGGGTGGGGGSTGPNITFLEVLNIGTYSHLLSPTMIPLWEQIILTNTSNPSQVLVNFTISSITIELNGTVLVNIVGSSSILVVTGQDTVIFQQADGNQTVFFAVNIPSIGLGRRLLSVAEQAIDNEFEKLMAERSSTQDKNYQHEGGPSRRLLQTPDSITDFAAGDVTVHIIYLANHTRIPQQVVGTASLFACRSDCDAVCAGLCQTRETSDQELALNPLQPAFYYVCNLTALPPLAHAQSLCPFTVSFVPDGVNPNTVVPTWPPGTWIGTGGATSAICHQGGSAIDGFSPNATIQAQIQAVFNACSDDENNPQCNLTSLHGTYHCIPPVNLNCTVDPSTNETQCNCANGYQDLQPTFSSLNSSDGTLDVSVLLDCRDINECNNDLACPQIGQGDFFTTASFDCVNTPGSFLCTCDGPGKFFFAGGCIANGFVCRDEFEKSCPTFSHCVAIVAIEQLACSCDCGYVNAQNASDPYVESTSNGGQCVPNNPCVQMIYDIENPIISNQADTEVYYLPACDSTNTTGGTFHFDDTSSHSVCSFQPAVDSGEPMFETGFPGRQTGLEYCCNSLETRPYMVLPSWNTDLQLQTCLCLSDVNVANIIAVLSESISSEVATLTTMANGLVYQDQNTTNPSNNLTNPFLLPNQPGQNFQPSAVEEGLPCSTCYPTSADPTEPCQCRIRSFEYQSSSTLFNPNEPLSASPVCFSHTFQLPICECIDSYVALINGTCVKLGDYLAAQSNAYANLYGGGGGGGGGGPSDFDYCAIPTFVNNSNLAGPCHGVHSCCTDQETTYGCNCQCGYTQTSGPSSNLAGDLTGPTCVDIDECAVYNVSVLCPTAPYTVCQNTPGSYCCTCDTVGYTVSFTTILTVDTLYVTESCPCGVQARCEASCVDIDECALHTDNCEFSTDPLVCLNEEGSYTCVNGTVVPPGSVV